MKFIENDFRDQNITMGGTTYGGGSGELVSVDTTYAGSPYVSTQVQLNAPYYEEKSFLPSDSPFSSIKSYKYKEDEYLTEITDYINSTYNQHYSKNKIQMAEVLIDCGHGTGFNMGNILKYAQRYGHKNNHVEWRKDLMKIIHYAIIQLYVHDKENQEKSDS